MRARIVLVTLAVSTFFFVTVETLPIGLLPQIASGVHVSQSSVGLLVTTYGLVVVVATIPLTRLTHSWRRRRLLTVLVLIAAGATALSAMAPNYPLLLAGRATTALSQAVFWAVVTPAAAALFAPQARGRAVAILYAGSSSGPLIGVPAGTWLGQQFGWRTPFLVLSVVGLAIAVVIAALMPDIPPGESHADRGSEPSRVRYRSLVVATALTVTGVFTAITVITPFLTDVSGIPSSAIAGVLLIRGVAGLSGVVVAGFLPDRHTWKALVVLTGLETVALLLQGVFAAHAAPAVASVALASLALSGIVTVNGTRVLQVAPAGTDMASAATSTAFNVGITAGALIGSFMLGTALRSTAFLAAGFALAGMLTFLLEPRLAARGREAPAPEPALSGEN